MGRLGVMKVEEAPRLLTWPGNKQSTIYSLSTLSRDVLANGLICKVLSFPLLAQPKVMAKSIVYRVSFFIILSAVYHQ